MKIEVYRKEDWEREKMYAAYHRRSSTLRKKGYSLAVKADFDKLTLLAWKAEEETIKLPREVA